MKCSKCGAEVVGAKFCMYCGQPLTELRVKAKPVRAHSGIMRFKQRASISQSALPDVQTRQPARSLELDSLKQSSGENRSIDLSKVQADTRIPSRTAARSTRQSRELEALLLKLNSSDDMMPEETECPEEDFGSLDIDLDTSLSNEPELDSSSLNDSFLLTDEGEANVSGPIPVGSGTFSKMPSGGFHLVLESIKSTCLGAVEKVRSMIHGDRDVTTIPSPQADKRKKIIGLSAAGAAAAALICIGVVTAAGNEPPEEPVITPAAVVPGQTAGNAEYAIVPLDEETDFSNYNFDDDEFSIPALENDGMADAAAPDGSVPAAETGTADAEGTIVVAENDLADETENKLTEKRLYGRKDNILAHETDVKKFKTNRYCIMREGPASRFGLIRQLPVGSTIDVLTRTEEDWVLEKGGLWKKDGAVKLGPGSQFSDAVSGMSLPQPKSRVISSDNWRYVQYKDIYGYIGPACFK